MLSKKKHAELWAHVDNEGFGYYMLHYGPDLKAIEALGFPQDQVKAAIELFEKIEAKINEAEEFAEEE